MRELLKAINEVLVEALSYALIFGITFLIIIFLILGRGDPSSERQQTDYELTNQLTY